MNPPDRGRTLLLLGALYFVQGLPYGFQITALPVYLRSAGVSLVSVGLASLVSLPWVLKLAAGPFVDRWGSVAFGRRRSWILPLQFLLAAVCGAAAFATPETELRTLLICVFAANVVAATMDVAVDALAVDLLAARDLGYGNIAQVVGYKVGMLVGGGLLVTTCERLGLGLPGVFLAMAALVLIASGIAFLVPEPKPASRDGESPTFAAVGGALLAAMRLPGARMLLLFVATYKLGETIADTMFRPFLVDAGFSTADLGFWLGTYGLIFSVVGSVLGGILASRIGPLAAVGWCATLRALAVGGEWWLVVDATPSAAALAGVVAAEQVFGGAVTTALFALMMSRVDRRIGATHYTLLATVEVAGKLLAAQLSGFLATALGYSLTFAIATTLAVAFLALLPALSQRHGSATIAT